jgi:hypothetical protein
MKKKKTSFLQNLFYNLIYVNLTIGTPSQSIPFQLNMNSQAFYISNNYFNPNQSSTYELLSENEISYSYEYGTCGYQSKDILKIDNISKKIDFIYETKTRKDNNMSNIGLLIPGKSQKGIYPFFTSLKNAGIITSYTWTLKYYNNISILDNIYKNENKVIGEFIIGDKPHNYESNKKIYNENDYVTVNPVWDFDYIYWDLYYNSVYLILKGSENNDSKIIIHDYEISEINLDISFIVGPNYFFSSIKKYFFDKYKDNCIEKVLDDTLFRYIECDNNGLFNVSSFPDIYFEHKEFETTFNLTYKDLFILDESTDKYLFLVFNNKQEKLLGFWEFIFEKISIYF